MVTYQLMVSEWINKQTFIFGVAAIFLVTGNRDLSTISKEENKHLHTN